MPPGSHHPGAGVGPPSRAIALGFLHVSPFSKGIEALRKLRAPFAAGGRSERGPPLGLPLMRFARGRKYFSPSGAGCAIARPPSRGEPNVQSLDASLRGHDSDDLITQARHQSSERQNSFRHEGCLQRNLSSTETLLAFANRPHILSSIYADDGAA